MAAQNGHIAYDAQPVPARAILLAIEGTPVPRHVLPLLALALLALAAPTAACADADAPDFPYELYLARLDGGRPTLISRSMNPHSPVWAWDSKSFAYIREKTLQDSELRVATPYGQTLAIDLEGRVYGVDISPGGYMAVVEEFENPRSQVLVSISPDGRLRRELDREDSWQAAYWIVGWADDHRLIVSRDYGDVSVLTEFHPDGTNRVFDLLPIAVSSTRPRFSPDTSQIAWGDRCGPPGARDGIWVLDLTEEAVRQVSSRCSAVDIEWSPDGRQLAAVVHGRSDEAGLYVLDVASSAERKIRPAPARGEDQAVRWVDGGFLLSRNLRPNCSDCGAPQSLFVPRDGSIELQVEDPNDLLNPNGLRVVEDYDLILQFDGGARSRVLVRGHPRWTFFTPVFSPDEKWVAFERYHCGECIYP